MRQEYINDYYRMKSQFKWSKWEKKDKKWNGKHDDKGSPRSSGNEFKCKNNAF